MDGNIIGKGLQTFANILIACFFIAVFGVAYIVFDLLSDKKTIKTKEKPVITWN